MRRHSVTKTRPKRRASITGYQFRLIIRRLDIPLAKLAQETAIPLLHLEACLAAEGKLRLTEEQEQQLRTYFGRSGVLIFKPHRRDPGVSVMLDET